VHVSYGRFEKARALWTSVLENLSDVSVASLEHASEIRDAVRYGLGAVEMRLGLESAIERMREIETNPRQRSTALTVRALICLQHGDWEGARLLRREAVQFDVENDVRQMFGHTNVRTELEYRALGLDLSGVKPILDELERITARNPGWLPSLHNSRGEYQRLLGNGERALDEFEASIARSEPKDAATDPDVAWYPAMTGKIETLLDGDRLEEAVAVGRAALDRADTTGVRFHGVKRALAIAEARSGEPEKARERILAILGECEALGTRGVLLGLIYEAAALIELAAGDSAAFERFAALTAGVFRRQEGSGFAARHERVLMKKPSTALDSLFAPDSRDIDATTLVARTMSAAGQEERASRGLSLLCERTRARRGFLYLAGEEGLVLVARSSDVAPTPRLEAFLAERATADQDSVTPDDDEAGETVIVDGAVRFEEGNRTYDALPIRAALGGRSSLVGFAALECDGNDDGAPPVIAHDIAAALGDYFLNVGIASLTQRFGED
jgi:hypothetical protein